MNNENGAVTSVYQSFNENDLQEVYELIGDYNLLLFLIKKSIGDPSNSSFNLSILNKNSLNC